MTSRERLRSILNHKDADKLAIDCGAMHSSGISAITYNALKKHLGIGYGQTRIHDVIQQLAIPEQWLLDLFKVDTVDLAQAFSEDPNDWIDWPLPDGSPAKFPEWIGLERRKKEWVCLNKNKEAIAAMQDGAFYFSQTQYPFYGKQIDQFDDLNQDIQRVSWLSLSDPLWKGYGKEDFFPSVERKAKKLYDETDYSIIANYGSLLFEPGQWLYRNDEFLAKMLTEPRKISKLFEKLTEIHLEKLGPFIKSIDRYADVLVTADDLGMQTGMLISPQLYKELVFPWHKIIFEFIKKRSNIKIFLHSCGGIFDVIPYLIEAGVDIINPVQTTANGMDPKTLKKEFGKDMVFWGGGIDTQHILPSGDEITVRAETRKNCEVFMHDGGFVFNPIHNILPGVPVGNILAIYEEANSIRYE